MPIENSSYTVGKLRSGNYYGFKKRKTPEGKLEWAQPWRIAEKDVPSSFLEPGLKKIGSFFEGRLGCYLDTQDLESPQDKRK